MPCRSRSASTRWSRTSPALPGPHLRPACPRNALEWPVSGRVTSRFGDRVGRFHVGIDIAAPVEGMPVVAGAAGKVVIAESLAEFGNVVVVDHGGGCTTLSAHLRELLVAAGDAVNAGGDPWAGSGRPDAKPGRTSTSRRGSTARRRTRAPCFPLKVTRRRPADRAHGHRSARVRAFCATSSSSAPRCTTTPATR